MCTNLGTVQFHLPAAQGHAVIVYSVAFIITTSHGVAGKERGRMRELVESFGYCLTLARKR